MRARSPSTSAPTPGFDAGVSVDGGGLCGAYEPNDSVAAAKLGAGSYPSLAICGNDVDVFAIKVPAGSVLTAGIDFKNDAGDLDLFLTDGTLLADGGTQILARSAGEADFEEIPNLPSAQERTLTPTATGGPASTTMATSAPPTTTWSMCLARCGSWPSWPSRPGIG